MKYLRTDSDSDRARRTLFCHWQLCLILNRFRMASAMSIPPIQNAFVHNQRIALRSSSVPIDHLCRERGLHAVRVPEFDDYRL
jgi:hypothetical protein